MMLYEAVHLQQSEAYYDYTNPTTAKMKERERVKVQRTKSLSNVQRFINQQQDISRRGSYVVGQKLRESKWFNHDELKVFCAVVETGFIVQRKDDINDELEFGIAVWNTGEEKSKNPEQIKIYALHPHKNNFRVGQFDLLTFWPLGTKLRIYNHCDKTETPHSEDVIRNQIDYAEATKQKWHNSEHFTYWCRYGPIQINQRVRNMTDAKWGSFGLNSGLLLIKKRIRRLTNSK
ncbi:uncharacterized protein l(1)G0469 [Atheta coriaria]|uniref:uncharacterized protein l(1)G0469 n=1 Tax=Dalotia coriaria TaxID=877792 RepID=UPI0031F3C4A1